MGTRTHDAADEEIDDGECIILELENGDVVLYDPGNHRAWIQSDDAISVSSHA